MKRPEYVAVVTAIYAAALREHREPTRKEMAQLRPPSPRQGVHPGVLFGPEGAAMFGTRPEGTRDPADLFAQAKQFYTRGGAPARAGDPLRPGQLGNLSPSPPGTPTATPSPPRGPPPARPHPAGDRGADRRPAGQDRGHGVRRPGPPGGLGGGALPPLSAVNALRREVLAGLVQARTAPPAREKPGPFARPKARKGPGNPCLHPVLPAVGTALPCQPGPGAGPGLPPRPGMGFPREGRGGTHPGLSGHRLLGRCSPDGLLTGRSRPPPGPGGRLPGGVTQALLGHVGQLAWPGHSAPHPLGDFWPGLHQHPHRGGTGPAWGLPRPPPPSSAGCPRSGTWARPCPPRPSSTAACP